MVANVQLPTDAFAGIFAFLTRRQRAKLVLMNTTTVELIPRFEAELRKLYSDLFAPTYGITEKRYRAAVAEMNAKTVQHSGEADSSGREGTRLLQALYAAEQAFRRNVEECAKQLNSAFLPTHAVEAVTRLKGRVTAMQGRIEVLWEKNQQLYAKINEVQRHLRPDQIDSLEGLIGHLRSVKSINEMELERARGGVERFELGISVSKTHAKCERIVMGVLPNIDHRLRRPLIEHYESVAQQYAGMAELSKRKTAQLVKLLQSYDEIYQRLMNTHSLRMEMINLQLAGLQL